MHLDGPKKNTHIKITKNRICNKQNFGIQYEANWIQHVDRM